MIDPHIVVDCCLPNDWVTFLAREGFRSVHWRDIGPANASDEEIVDHATESGAIILTQDLDFGSILALQNLSKPSVIQIRDDSPIPEEVGSSVLNALSMYQAELMSGAIATVYAGRSRIRLLPLT